MDKVQILGLNDVVYMTDSTTDVASITPHMLDQAGLTYTNDSRSGFYPLTEGEGRLIAEDYIDIGGTIPMNMAYSVLYDGTKYYALQDEISTEMEDDFGGLSVEDENENVKARALALAGMYSGHIIWSNKPYNETEYECGCFNRDYLTAVLIPMEEISARHESLAEWRNELESIDIRKIV